ncbi:MAG: pirin family protein [Gammaproteobacteria bacterium]|nr:pirin family protein [Gammaproteobacteria bacterium]
MQKQLDPAESRGIADHGWLYSRHSFSFADYHNPERMGFGKLRVINDDIVAAGEGFPTHSHANMEIVSIPLHGSLRHQDSLGSIHTIETGDIQIMSAGTGITHSEYNGSDKDSVNFLQIWIIPQERGITPRYDQKTFDPAGRHNQFQTILSPERDSADSLWINQDAWFTLADFEQEHHDFYDWHAPGHGLYLFVISGRLIAGGEVLSDRDGIAVTDANTLSIRAISNSRILLMEVPLS